MQTEPMPLLISAEPTLDSKDETDRCDMCRYKSLCDQWDWHDMYHIIEQGLSNTRVDTSADLVKKLEYLCKDSLLTSAMTTDMLSTIDIDNWFIHDYYKEGGGCSGGYHITADPNERVRVPRRRVYFWDDEITDYEALCQTIVNLLSVIDDWVWEQDEGETYPMLYYKVDGEKTMIASIIDIYDTIIDMYFTVMFAEESEDEECDSVS